MIAQYHHLLHANRYIFTKKEIISDVIAGLRLNRSAAATGAEGHAASRLTLQHTDVEVLALREWNVGYLPALDADKKHLWHGAEKFNSDYRLMVCSNGGPDDSIRLGLQCLLDVVGKSHFQRTLSKSCTEYASKSIFSGSIFSGSP